MAVDKLVDSTQLDGDLTSVANAIRTKGGTSASLAFPADFVSAIAAIPSGGGGSGATKVAYGSFTGNSTDGRMDVFVGKKMPQTDFFVIIKAQNNTAFARNSDYTFVEICAFLPSAFGSYDLSQDGNSARPFTSAYTVKDNNSGTITDKTAGRTQKIGLYIRSGNLSNFAWDTFNIYRKAADAEFYIHFGHSNAVYKWPSTVTYEWEIWYFGSNPGQDIVTIP